MTYAEDHGHVEYRLPDGSMERVEIGTRRFYELADYVFFRWNEPLHDVTGKFGRIFDYERFRGKKVLEIGCGMGCMASQWASHGANITAIDLNPVAIEKTTRRFELFGLKGDIREVDAETLPFADATFDLVYSWGVIHHTPGIEQAAREIFRVLKPGGRLALMLYNRDSVLYKYFVSYQEGVLNLERQFLDELGLASRYGDGGRQEGNPHTWPVTDEEVRRELLPMCENVSIKVLGTDVPEALNTWFPRLGQRLPLSWRKALARRWGWSLWITGDKAA
ncbi:class I SAM-dependent methyltransferase [Haematospirillum jordaniae]|nr:class I SAM-dependent methyltransferase [Haematospirillum jordaniae]NKD57959.1 class I SAM-dependent methyltransferase [Haematospirillum jordaniae]NKD60018.1 class I SAM-dependent methyltransferase [Haematospirillum jordaniae]NKD67954.1 class I SAM-dependent methyltransferase [Haematospirillum jordaniae]NKD80047.1 class I SAM-dependent methyltransferase [Haematospirillum jordaniae]